MGFIADEFDSSILSDESIARERQEQAEKRARSPINMVVRSAIDVTSRMIQMQMSAEMMMGRRAEQDAVKAIEKKTTVGEKKSRVAETVTQSQWSHSSAKSDATERSDDSKSEHGTYDTASDEAKKRAAKRRADVDEKWNNIKRNKSANIDIEFGE